MAEIFDERKERRKADGFRGYRCKGEIITHMLNVYAAVVMIVLLILQCKK